MPSPLTIIYPYYYQPYMLAYQLSVMEDYPQDLSILIVDDGSPVPAAPIIIEHASAALLRHLRLYRVLGDIPWNREEARNLGAHEAQTAWIIQMDIDHVLPAACVPTLLDFMPDPARWYRFPRYRRGQADSTRNKDALPRDCVYGKIHPHIDSYLVRKATYWDAGGYNEDFSGVLGGGSEFLERLGQTARASLLPDTIFLEVVTSHVVADASDTHCSRDTAPGKTLWRGLQAQGRVAPKPTSWLRLPWKQVL